MKGSGLDAYSCCTRARQRSASVRGIAVSFWRGTIVMQSVGQTGTHFSQPVQSAAITPCRNLFAPTIASVGQTFSHKEQPMQFGSSMTATFYRVRVD